VFIPLNSNISAQVKLLDLLKPRIAGKFSSVLRLYHHERLSTDRGEVRWSSRELVIPNGRRQIIANKYSPATGRQAAPTDYRCLLTVRKYMSKAETAVMV
jgi:hypothetical protein